MKRFIQVVCVLIAVIALKSFWRPAMDQMDEIEYQGETIKLTKLYTDYDDYKEDPDKLAPSELARAGRLVREARVAPSYPSRDRMVRDVFNLKFPGYGMASFGEKPRADGSVLAGFGIVVPGTENSRILTFLGRDGVYRLIDDFVEPDELRIMGVTLEDGVLKYKNMDQKDVLIRKISAK